MFTSLQVCFALVTWLFNKEYSWICHSRLVGTTIDHKVTWAKHLTDLKNSFVAKLNLPKKCSFLKRKSLLDLYFKVILPSVSYGITIWGNCNNLNHIKSLQALQCRAANLIYNLPWDTPSKTLLDATNWETMYDMYKINLAKLIYNIVSDNTPHLISDLAMWQESIQPRRT